uniref:Uncharacterized protein n=1 Tax=Anopheles coluzzii TaxID=1518534 RepID=A0A8W7PYF4_ANOCL
MASGSESSDEFYDALDDSVLARSRRTEHPSTGAGHSGATVAGGHHASAAPHTTDTLTQRHPAAQQDRIDAMGESSAFAVAATKRSHPKPTGGPLGGPSAAFAEQPFKEPKSVSSVAAAMGQYSPTGTGRIGFVCGRQLCPLLLCFVCFFRSVCLFCAVTVLYIRYISFIVRTSMSISYVLKHISFYKVNHPVARSNWQTYLARSLFLSNIY